MACSAAALPTWTVIVIRLAEGSTVGPTESESMLKPRRRIIDATRWRTPGWFSTSTDSSRSLRHYWASTNSSSPLPRGTIG